MKKFFALILSITLIISCSSAVFAAETGKFHLSAESKSIEVGTGTDSTYREIVQKYPAAAEYIYSELKNNYQKYVGGTGLNVYNFKIPFEDRFALYYGVINEYRDLYYIDLINCSLNSSGGYVYEYKPKFLFNTADEIKTASKAIEKQIKKYLSGVDSNWSDFQKARYLHDLVAVQTEYVNTDKTVEHSAYGILVNKEGVCQGYSHAYAILLDRCNIVNTIATSPEPYMQHEWNQVMLDGKFYNVDVTWDDPRINAHDTLGNVSHEYFLSSDALFASEGNEGHHDWTGEDATDTTYDNAWWKTIESCIYYDGENNKEYYIKKETHELNSDFQQGVFTERNCADGEERTLSKIQRVWSAGGGYSWPLNFTTLACYNGDYYFNSTDKICKMNPEDSSPQIIYNNDKEYEVYGLRITPDANLDYCVKESPNSEDNIYTIDLKNEVERAIDTELTIDNEDDNFLNFGIPIPDDGYTGLNLLGVQLKSAEEQTSMRFISLISSDVLKNASEYGYVFTTTSKETATAKSLASKLTVENGHKYICTDTINTMTGNYGSGDFNATGYKYVTAAINNITSDKAVVARLYIIDNNGNVHYGKYIDSNNVKWDGCAARLSDLTD